MTDAGTFQNSTGSQPVSNLQPPPEGTMAAQLTFVLTPVQPSAISSQQLSSQGGLQMSQVCTICIDNSVNGYAISVTHGVFNEVSIVPAFGAVVLPTFSTRGGAYAMLISALIEPGAVLSSSLTVNVILMNFPRAPGSFGNMVVSSIIGANQNVQTIISGFGALTTSIPSVHLAGPGNFIISNIDMFCQSVQPAAAGTLLVAWELRVDVFTSPFVSETIASGQESFTAPNANIVPGPAFTFPISINYNQGLLMPRNGFVTLNLQGSINFTQALFRVNLYGVSTP